MTIDLSALVAHLQGEKAPVSYAALKKRTRAGEEALGAAIRDAVNAKQLFPWPDFGATKQRYWHVAPEVELRRRILEFCSTRAVKKSDIKIKGFKQSAVLAQLAELISENALRKYPPLGRETALFGTADAPQAYHASLRAFVEAKLKKAGLAPEPAPDSLRDDILRQLPLLEPQVDVPVSVARLRRALGLAEGGKQRFDEAVLKLRGEQLVYLSQHDNPHGIEAADRDWLIDGKDGKYYVAISLRSR